MIALPHASLVTTTLVGRSAWFLLPAVILSLAMVYAMMECVTALLARPSHREHASSRAALFAQLLMLNHQRHAYCLQPSRRADLDVLFDPVDPTWRARFATVKLTTGYHARLLLDEDRREARWFEVVWSRSRFVGFDNMRPCISWGMWIFAGYIDVHWTGRAYGMLPGFPPRIGGMVEFSLDTVAVKRQIRAIVSRAGWTFRPKVWPFQVRRRADGTVPRGLLPSVTRYWTERQFWTTAYAVLYVLTVLYIAVAAGGWEALATRATLLPLLGFSAFWWLVSGSLMLMFRVLGQR